VRAAILATACAAVLFVAGAAHAGGRAVPGVVFSSTGRGPLVLTAPGYRLSLSRQNGAIVDLVDRSTNAHVTHGSLGGCLWGASAPGGTPDYLGGCSYKGSAFAWRWNRASSTLTLSYGGTGGLPLSATVTLVAGTTSFDLSLQLASRSTAPIQQVLFPSDLLVTAATITAGYQPTYLPGVRVLPGYFTGREYREMVFRYPSRWAFADYLALEVAGGQLALYGVNPAPDPVQPVDIGFIHHGPDPPCGGADACVTHRFATWIRNTQTWTSPVVRIELGANVQQTILAYRTANGLDDYPSAAQKLGARFDTLARSPLIKADPWHGLPPFSDWQAELQQLPSPALLHPIGFQTGGFDVNDPDFLPPDPLWGSTGDLASAVATAHALGLSVMPYINLSWWDAGSPTAQDLAPRSYALLDSTGQPVADTYGKHTGYVTSPFAPAVKSRLAQTLDEWTNNVPADCLFFDQIGARPPALDFNPASPSPTAYDDGWLSQFAAVHGRCLMVEDGWDRLAQSFVGFHGSLLLHDRKLDELDRDWGVGNEQPYPLGDWLFHDKVLMYQHDAYPETMTADLDVLRFNLAYGFVLSYDWNDWDSTLTSPWLSIVGAFQHVLGPLYVGKALTSYAEPAPNVTESRFGDLTVVANWDGTKPLVRSGYTIAPGGFLATTADGSVVGAALSGGRYLVVDHGKTVLDVTVT
jgi:hypothetical protein